MNPVRNSAWLPITGAFILWFVHFLVCWAAVEIWPRQWIANKVAWGATAVALLLLGALWVRVEVGTPPGETAHWTCRLARGGTALAAVAVLFSALPSLVFVP